MFYVYECLLIIDGKITHRVLLQALCKSHPVEFASYFHYCHSLTFDQRPDYSFLRRLFRDLFDREGIPFGIIVCNNLQPLLS